MRGFGDGSVGHAGELLQADAIDAGGEGLAALTSRLEELGHCSDRLRRIGLTEAPEPAADSPAPLADAAADEDRVVRTLDAVVFLDRVPGQADVADVMLAAGVGAAADLDAEATETRRKAVGRRGVLEQPSADALRHPHRARDGQGAVVH